MRRALLVLALACGLVSACGEGTGDGAADAPAGTGGDVVGGGDVTDGADVAGVDGGGAAADADAEPSGDVDWAPPDPVDLLAHVDPLIGTDGPGNVVPGALVPFGMVKLSPDSLLEAGDIDAYEYGAERLEGFTHTHLEGPGGSGNGYSQLLVTAIRGDVRVTEEGYAGAFSHDREEARPGAYAVTLDDAAVDVALTATAHCGVHRYTFRGDAPAHVLLDVGHSNGQARSGAVRIDADGATLRGVGHWAVHPAVEVAVRPTTEGTTSHRRLHFVARLDRTPDAWGTWLGDTPSPGAASVEGRDVGAWVTFENAAGAPVEVRLCVSAIDEAQAEAHLAAEVEGRSFEDVRAAAEAAWNDRLNVVRVEGGTDDERTMFYTALYHALFQPADLTEDGRFWSGWDGEGAVFEADGWRYYADDWCLWDTFRTTHPLQLLVAPDTRSDVVRSFLHAYEQGGWLPKCTWHATGYSRVMIGNHAVPVIVDSFLKGFRRFDVDRAWQAVEKAATEDVPNAFAAGLCGFMNLGTPPEYIENGYVSHECDSLQSVSMTLEYAYNDWTTMRFAEALGRDADVARYAERARNYANHWNPDANGPGDGFMQARSRDGGWMTPFDPTANDVDFCEADAWIYTWFVPHDVAGLIDLMGGRDAFVTKLDAFFDGGHDDPSNEPDFHAPYLYVYAGQPWKTADRVRAWLGDAFAATPDGLPGNDDAGATSAWYVFSALGLYPVAPGDGVYVLGSPLFERATLHLDPRHFPAAAAGGGTFVIEAPGVSDTDRYVQSATLNGAPLDRAWLWHDEVVAGGTLRLEMGATPSDWATAPSAAPPSLSAPVPRASAAP